MGNNVVSTAAAPAKEAKIAEQKPKPAIARKSRPVKFRPHDTTENVFVVAHQMGKPTDGGPPPLAPPSYSQATGGVPPASPFTPGPVPGTHHSHHAQQGPIIVTTVVPVGPHGTHMICPSCHAEINTTTDTKPGPIAYISGFIIALFGCWCGCCLIPCCMDECMDVHHNCPNCQAYLGRFRR